MTEGTLMKEQVLNTLLCELGAGLTGFLIGVPGRSHLAVRRAVALVGNEEETRLITAYEVFTTVAAQEGSDVARAWMVGMNPNLGDQSPLGAIAHDRHEDALTAARTFLGG